MTTLIGTNPDQIPVNSMLGGMAYQDPDSINVKDFNSSGSSTINTIMCTGLLSGLGQIYLHNGEIQKSNGTGLGLGGQPNLGGPETLQIYGPSSSGLILVTASSFGSLSLDNSALNLTAGSGKELYLYANNTPYICVTTTGDILNLGVGATKLQTGTTAQRPSSPAAGMVRYNSSLQYTEVHNGIIWSGVVTSDRGVFFQPVYLGTTGSAGQLRFYRGGDGALRATMTAQTSNTVLDCNTELLLQIGSTTIADITSTGVAVTGLVTSTGDAVGSNDLTRLGLFLRSHAANGYQKLPGGLYIQWGTVYVGDPTIYTGSVSFPITFPTAVFNVVASVYDTSATSGVGATLMVAVTSQNSSGFNFGTREFTGSIQGASITYIAIGY